jgi:hypothetical protein
MDEIDRAITVPANTKGKRENKNLRKSRKQQEKEYK